MIDLRAALVALGAHLRGDAAILRHLGPHQRAVCVSLTLDWADSKVRARGGKREVGEVKRDEKEWSVE